MNSANVEMLELAAAAFADLPDEVVFVGGATVELWATDEAAPEFRPTDDVDVIVEITTRTAYYRFEERLRGIGFLNEEDDGVATKLEAFRSRGKGDLYGSRDFEDVIVLVDSREELVGEMAAAAPALREFSSEQLGELLRHEVFESAAEGALKGGTETRERFELVVRPRIDAIVSSGAVAPG